MKMMFKAIPLLAICAAAPAMATMTVNYDLGTAKAVDWLGSAGDNNFANASNWSDNTVPQENTSWRYAHFNLVSPTVVTNAFNDAYGAQFNLFGVVVEAGSAQLTIGKLSAPTSQASKMMRFYPATNNRTAFVNYSDTHAIFDCYVNFFGFRDNDGRSGVHPGAEYNQELRMRDRAGYTLVFFSGEPSWSDYRKTSVINKKIDCDENSVSNNIEIQVDHIVLLAEGSEAECADFTVDGTLVVSNATVTAKGSLSGNGEIVVAGNGGTISAASLPSKITLAPGFSLNGNNRLVTSFELKVAKHDGLTVTADNFDIKPVGVTPAALDASIAEEGDYWIVTIAPSEFIPCKTDVWGQAWDGGSTWNGDVACEAGRHYIVRSQNNASQNPANRRLNSPKDDPGGTFPGDSLTLVADSGLCSLLALKGNAAYTFNRLNLGANGAVRFYTGATTVAGNIYVGSDTANEPASFGNSHETACTVSADISGTGSLHIQPTDVNNTVKNFNLTLSGDNSNFTGELVIESNTHEETLAKAYVTITTANALGGGKVTIDNSTLKVLDDITADQTFTFSNSPVVEVASGKTLTLSGSGSSGAVIVSGGTLKAANAYAAGGIEIASGTAELPSVSATAEELSARKFPAKDWLFVPGGSLESSAADNLALVTEKKGWSLPANYGLAGKWMTTLGQRAESVAGVEGVMLTVSGRVRGFMIVIR